MKASHKIVYNTFILYVKLIIVMIIGFVNVRIVLDALGETDFGIYTLVAGVVGMLALLQSAMSTTSMRYMSHSLGKANPEYIKKTFNTTLFIHIILGVVVVGFIEIGGYFMFENMLQIPSEKVFDAKVIFHFMAVSTFIAVIAVPYDAVINSHENLFFLSLVDIFGAVMRLIVSFYLLYSSSNLLIIYGGSLLLIELILRIIKQRYSVLHYTECKINYRAYFDKRLSKEILSFTMWNLFGSLSAISVIQARSILLNMFFGVNINAAEGISNNMASKVNTFSNSMTKAVNPQLVKEEGKGNRDRMMRLLVLSTKYSTFLFLIFMIPLFIEAPSVLNLWLKEVPAYSVIFTRLLLVGMLVEKLSFEITNAIRAVGKIRNFQLTETAIVLFNIPLSYFLFTKGFPPHIIYIVAILFICFKFIDRLIFGRILFALDIKYYFFKGIVPFVFPSFLSIISSFLIMFFIEEGIIRLFLNIMIPSIVLFISFYYLGISKQEKQEILIMKTKVITKFFSFAKRS